jgi:branched-chain amino acid transport system permease protein
MLINALNGLVYGSLLFVLSAGLVLIYGLRRVVNFANGALCVLGAYIGYSAAIRFGFFTGVVAAGLGLALVGVALDIGVFRQLSARDPLVTVIVTFGILLMIEYNVRLIWSTKNYAIDPPELLSGVLPIGGASFPVYRLFIVAASAAVALAMSAACTL